MLRCGCSSLASHILPVHPPCPLCFWSLLSLALSLSLQMCSSLSHIKGKKRKPFNRHLLPKSYLSPPFHTKASWKSCPYVPPLLCFSFFLAPYHTIIVIQPHSCHCTFSSASHFITAVGNGIILLVGIWHCWQVAFSFALPVLILLFSSYLPSHSFSHGFLFCSLVLFSLYLLLHAPCL